MIELTKLSPELEEKFPDEIRHFRIFYFENQTATAVGGDINDYNATVKE